MEQRAAFKCWPVLDRRHQGSGAAPIRAVAVDDTGRNVYLGLEAGLLEEYTLVEEAGGCTASLTARKHVSKRSIVGITHLGAANCLAVLHDDGSMHLLECDSLKAQLLPLKYIVAACVDQRPGQRPRLALAMKPSRRTVRVEVYEAPVGAEIWGRRAPLATADVPDSSAVKGMGWVGPHLVLCTGLKYLLVAPAQQQQQQQGGQWRELFCVPEDLAYSPVMIQPLPQRGQAMLIVGPAGILIDASGSPVGSALRLDGLATPRALAASGPFLLAACEDAIHVFDSRGGGEEVQLLQYGAGLRPAPGQPMFAACSPSGSCVAVAGRAVVWACLPVPAEEQARELLRRREYSAATELAEAGRARGEAWAEVASAQAALCMLYDCLFEEAVEALERCSPDAFQPVELFPLFPEHTQPWLAQVPSHKRYWGLHPPLQSLDTLISRRLARLSAAPSPRSEISSARLEGAAAAAERSPNGTQQAGLASAGSSEGLGQQQQQHRKVLHAQLGSEGGEAAEELRKQALQALVQYLFRVRMLGGVQYLDGVDTLLLHLLMDLGAAREVAAFAAVPNRALMQSVAGRLQSKGWHHALATLWAARGNAEAALRIWRHLVEGGQAGATGAQDAAVQAAERREALESAAALLRDPATVPGPAALAVLSWLLPASPTAALTVLTARPLPPHAVLAALPADSDVRWQYLDHLVQRMADEGAGKRSGSGSGSSEGGSRPGSATPTTPASEAAWTTMLQELSPAARRQVHTELATQLVAPILRAEPQLRLAGTVPPPRPPSRPGSRRVSQAGAASGSSLQGGGAAAGGRSTLAVGGEGGSGGGGSSRWGSAAAARSTAALVSRWLGEEAAEGLVGRLRLRLRRHLEESSEYDRGAVLEGMAGSGLHEELVVLHCQMGDHLSALRLLALTLRDISGAEAYATAHLPPSEYRTLLQLLLHPGPGVEPLYEEACYLITALGDHLDPMDILATLPPSMPLSTASGILAPILRDRLHRRRQGAVTKNLHRAQLTAARAEQCDAEAGRVVVDDERACQGCHLRIGGKVFVLLQQQQQEKLQGGLQAQQQQQQGGRNGGREAAGAAAAGAARHMPAGGNGGGRQQQQQKAAGREVWVVCYNCYRRMGGGGTAAGAGRPGEASTAASLAGGLDALGDTFA